MKRILAATPRLEAFDAIKHSLQGDQVDHAATREDALAAVARKSYDYIFLDIEFLGEAGDVPDACAEELGHFRTGNPAVEIIAMSSSREVKSVVQAVKAGASNYLNYPLHPSEVEYVVRSLYRARLAHGELDYLRDKFWRADAAEIVRSHSSAMQELFVKVKLVAPTRSTVLLTGETGVGKSLIAKLIHSHSNRSQAPFIAVHCGAIPDTLLESELFGHEKGAFTGAVRRRLGKFELAAGGTIFLDEAGSLTPPAQIKLLQVLQEKCFQRVGGEATISVDVRVIAAANVDLQAMCEAGMFRRDLYYRLNVFPLHVPALSERTEDIPLLAEVFLNRLNKEYLKEIASVGSEVLRALQSYSWPGNVRELENLMERAYILEPGRTLSPVGFPSELFTSRTFHAVSTPKTAPVNLSLSEARQQAVDDFEKTYLHGLLSRCSGSIKETASQAGITPRQLHKLMTRHKLRKEDYR